MAADFPIAFHASDRERLVRMEATLTNLLKEIQRMSQTLDALKSQVAASVTVEASAVTLINGIAGQIAALADTKEDADLAGLADQLKASAASLATAVTANTPAAPAPAPASAAPAAPAGS
jgi:predicted  nucleic acid-binding Zn-ribbon protein